MKNVDLDPLLIDGCGSAFRTWFRMPLCKVEALVDNYCFDDKGWIPPTSGYSEPSLSFVSECIFWWSWTAST